ncbi:hypothetical protein ONE63_005309 [Megalurothrips usitatus]|uniref:Mitochondrial import inner membrane translocase subunit Tim21 n=1 Tax=Megalurothrips usitatus TaxID=439358 RepID=A0AAV7XY91_9NEOP|nr:hypothetical protein ONE63_005309 [Megalurothrips usitatus]
MSLVKISAAIAAAGGVILAATYGRKQRELKDAKWFRESAVKVASHEGVNRLIGHPPLEMGDVTRSVGTKYKPLLPVEPEPLYILEVPIKGSKGEGHIRMYLNYLVPIEVVRKDISAWNVALIEVQVGEDKENRFVV